MIRRLGTAAASFTMWCYTAGAVLVWFAIPHLHDTYVVAFLVARILGDIIWIPFACGIWAWLLFRIVRYFPIARVLTSVQLVALCVVVPSAVTAITPDMSFRYLFIPLGVYFAFIVTASVKRTPVSAVRLPVIVMAAAFIIRYGFQLIPLNPYPDGGMAVSVMTYNILGDADEHHRREVINVILRESPDIVCCTEFNPRMDPELFNRELAATYPYMISNRSLKSWRTGEFICSRYPLRDLTPQDPAFINILVAEVMINGETIILTNLHLPRNLTITDLLSSEQNIREKIQAIDKSVQPLVTDTIQTVETVLSHLGKTSEPLIICGDFNDTPGGRVYSMFDRVLSDAFAVGGWGTGETFGEAWLDDLFSHNRLVALVTHDVIRIDHIFVGADFAVRSARVIRGARGSDHKPLVADLILK